MDLHCEKILSDYKKRLPILEKLRKVALDLINKALEENIVSCTKELFGCTRKAACLGNAVLLSVLSAPCMLGFNLWSSFQPFGKGSCVLDLEDFILSNILLPLGALIFVLFCTWKHGWGWDNFIAEANTGKGLKIQAWMRPVMSYVMPVIILVIWIAGFIK